MLLHVVEAGEAIGSGWALTESPPPVVEMWRQVAPAPGEAQGRAAWLVMSTAGLFRALTVSALWLVALSVSTRTRAGVGLVLVVLVSATGVIVHALRV